MSQPNQQTTPNNDWNELIAATRQSDGDAIADLLEVFIKHRPDAGTEHWAPIVDELKNTLIRCTSLSMGLPADNAQIQSEADANRVVGGTNIGIQDDASPSATTSGAQIKPQSNDIRPSGPK